MLNLGTNDKTEAVMFAIRTISYVTTKRIEEYGPDTVMATITPAKGYQTFVETLAPEQLDQVQRQVEEKEGFKMRKIDDIAKKAVDKPKIYPVLSDDQKARALSDAYLAAYQSIMSDVGAELKKKNHKLPADLKMAYDMKAVTTKLLGSKLISAIRTATGEIAPYDWIVQSLIPEYLDKGRIERITEGVYRLTPIITHESA
ncbi:MAG: hypothetical protein ABI361_02140 [Nitrososphaera sp.]|jgi:hypothetical protein